MAFDPLRSRKEALEREQRLALLAEKRAGMEALPDPGQAEYERLKLDSSVGTSANGIGGGVEDGPQYRAIAKKFREMRYGGGIGPDGRLSDGATFSPDNPYVAHASAYVQGGNATPGTLGEIALGRAANDALQYELAKRALDERLAPLTRGRPRALATPFVRSGGPA